MPTNPFARMAPGRTTRLPVVPLRPSIPPAIKHRRNNEHLQDWEAYEQQEEVWRQRLNQMLSELVDASSSATVENIAAGGDAGGSIPTTIVSGGDTDPTDDAPIGDAYVLATSSSVLTGGRVLTGTPNQVYVTDNGPGSSIVLSLPQDIHAAARPQFAAINLIDGVVSPGLPLILGTQQWNDPVGAYEALTFDVTDSNSDFNTSYYLNLKRNGTTVFRVHKTGDVLIDSANSTVSSLPALEVKQTWDAGGYFEGIRFTITDTSSAILSRMLIFYNTGVPIFAVRKNGILEFVDDLRQTFNPGNNLPGLNVGGNATDPVGTLVNGDLWYNSTSNLLKAYINSLTRAVVVTDAAAAQGDLLYGSAANVWSRLTKDANATRYLSNTGASNNPAWAQVNLANGVTGTLPVTNGGTGAGTFPNKQILYGQGTSAIGSDSDFTWDPAVNLLTLTNGDITLSDDRQITFGVSGYVRGDNSSTGTLLISGVTTHDSEVLITPAANNISLAITDAWDDMSAGAGSVVVTSSWNGAGSYNGLVMNITNLASGAGSRLISLNVGGSPKATIDVAGDLFLATPLKAVYGGTGFGSYTIGDILYANTTSTLARLNDVATGNALISGGVGAAPSWGKVGITTHVSAALGANRVLYMNSANNAITTDADFIFDGSTLDITANGTTTPLRLRNSGNGGTASYGALRWDTDGGTQRGLLSSADDVGGPWGMFILFGTSAAPKANDRIGELDFVDTTIGSTVTGITSEWDKDGATIGFHMYTYTGSGTRFNVWFDGNGGTALGAYSDYNQTRPPSDGLSVSGAACFGRDTATAKIHAGAGSTAASSAPLKFTTGTSMTTAEAGAMEFTTDDLFFTITTGAARKRLLMADPTGGLTSGRVPFATTNGRLTDDADMTFATDTLSVTKAAVKAGSSTGNIAKVGGVIYQSLTEVANSGTSYSDLWSQSVAANVLATDGDCLHFVFSGKMPSGGGGNTQIKALYGSTAILTSGTVGLALGVDTGWIVEGWIYRTGATTQKCIAKIFTDRNDSLEVEYTTPAETLSGAVTLKVQAKGNSGANEVYFEAGFIEWLPVP